MAFSVPSTTVIGIPCLCHTSNFSNRVQLVLLFLLNCALSMSRHIELLSQFNARLASGDLDFNKKVQVFLSKPQL